MQAMVAELMGPDGSSFFLGGHVKGLPLHMKDKIFLERKEHPPPQRQRSIREKSVWVDLGSQALWVNTHLPRAWGNMVLEGTEIHGLPFHIIPAQGQLVTKHPRAMWSPPALPKCLTHR